jgi:2-keto-3-deoxy-L-rhamnonate aldolase RhmA
MGMYGGASVNYQRVTDFTAAAQSANDNIFIGIIVETVDAVENIEDLLQSGVDFAMVGFADLAQDYGVIGQHQHELVRAAQRTVQQACERAGVVFAAPIGSLAGIAPAIESGAQLIMYRGVLAMVYDDVHAAVGQLPRRPSDGGAA